MSEESKRQKVDWKKRCLQAERERDDLKARQHCAIHGGIGALDMVACPACFVGLRHDLQVTEELVVNLRTALAFYAEIAHWMYPEPWKDAPVQADMGQRAANALLLRMPADRNATK